MKRILVKILGYQNLSFVFLGSVIGGYLLLAFFDFEKFKKGTNFSLNIFYKLIPVMFLIFILLWLVNQFVSPNSVLKHLGDKSGLRGWLFALAGGIISTGPIYMWYPLLKTLKERGMKESLIAVFLYNRAVKIPMIPLMIYYFNLKLVIVLTFWMLCASIFVGLIVGKILKK